MQKWTKEHLVELACGMKLGKASDLKKKTPGALIKMTLKYMPLKVQEASSLIK